MPSTTTQPRIITRTPRRQGFRYPDSTVEATLALLNEAQPDQVVGIDEPQPTRSKALGKAHKMREQLEQRGELSNGRVLRKTVVQEGDAYVPAVYVVTEPRRKAKTR